MKVRLTDTSVLDELRVAMSNLQVRLMTALSEVDGDMKRFMDVMQGEHLNRLRKSIPVIREELVQLKSQLARKQMSAQALKISVSVVDERRAIARAEQRLGHTEELIRRTNAWIVKMRREHDQFRSQASMLATLAERDIPDAMHRLKAMAQALDAYLSMSAGVTLDERVRLQEAVETVFRRGVVDGVAKIAEDGEEPGKSPVRDGLPTMDERRDS